MRPFHTIQVTPSILFSEKLHNLLGGGGGGGGDYVKFW